VEKNWSVFAKIIPDQMERCRKFLEETPENRLLSGGKLKKLKGKLSGILQYDLTGKARIHYRINHDEYTIYVEYIGQHP
jgi:mRNA-degrading endonuclease RelE of RelBE toxin-antitoxin system